MDFRCVAAHGAGLSHESIGAMYSLETSAWPSLALQANCLVRTLALHCSVDMSDDCLRAIFVRGTDCCGPPTSLCLATDDTFVNFFAEGT